MISLQLNSSQSLEVLELLIRNGKNELADQLKIAILEKLEDYSSVEEARIRAAGSWLSKQQTLINKMKEDNDVG